MNHIELKHEPCRVNQRWLRVTDTQALQELAAWHIFTTAVRAIEQRGRFLIVLAGGNTPQATYRLLREAVTDWSCWHVYFGDERCLPIESADRNSRMVLDSWLNEVPIPAANVHIIPAGLGAEAAANAYSATLQDVGCFDLVVLGLGEDGHIAGLFPGNDLGSHAQAPDVLAVFDAPKHPSERVSLSARRLSHTREVLMLVTGEAKRNAVLQLRTGADIPAQQICRDAVMDVLVESMLLPDESNGSRAQ
ncbi:6-phosphogluconolactonase [Perlucidibaca aquatica]|uniref:6-phosphogluconolactonase n=1 Tax=Perlucidibaca aquatica TaxID=1852776 RepID=UPI0009EE18EE|nr:6-phosphogluconolactonase [Perlucidibaca aquatica]